LRPLVGLMIPRRLRVDAEKTTYPTLESQYNEDTDTTICLLQYTYLLCLIITHRPQRNPLWNSITHSLFTLTSIIVKLNSDY
jgi:hypothetical protein